MRKLATIRTISEIRPIEGADAIVMVKVDGWECVALKEEFRIGDPCMYFEIDSLIPLTPAVEHLRARAYKKMGDKEGIRIKTIRLRGQISQGLALPLNRFPEVGIESAKIPDEYPPSVVFNSLTQCDWTEILGVLKYEPPTPAELGGQVRGNFPSFIKKTDQERCQNLGYHIFTTNKDARYEVTMKLHGTSFTAFFIDGRDGVCSRNWELQLDETNEHNALVRLYIDSGLQTALRKYGRNIAIQGELMGPKILSNREGLMAHKLFVFDIYNIDSGCQSGPIERMDIMRIMCDQGLNKNMVDHVPVLAHNVTFEELCIHDVSELLVDADGPSIVHPIREGKVYKRMDGQFSFKCVSNNFLLKERD